MRCTIATNSRRVHSLVRNIDKVLYYRREDTIESCASDNNNNDLGNKV